MDPITFSHAPLTAKEASSIQLAIRRSGLPTALWVKARLLDYNLNDMSVEVFLVELHELKSLISFIIENNSQLSQYDEMTLNSIYNKLIRLLDEIDLFYQCQR
ncbi:hypothetical protein LHV13_04535 [Ferrovum sp. PN-J185]|uniref:hypothetical protein n=1 Tax=Ferrovum sp. PN-J185 TaxID=1356306 RepID=UPI001E3BC28E|nr:hypothetical protein [Ferrovum sp. PN-J185]MCC6068444.1 hypothetical protein [Ferrovum sp. PN-J185]MDE1891551.1 hypothetical protein [Betaproteobacteria bacterium]MDE2055885.1 hypothetical protein [Betaproteobacteria bacterium]